jgi:hypothetical protein
MQGGSSTLDANPITEQSEGLFFVVGGGVAFVSNGAKVENDSMGDDVPRYPQADGITTATRGAFFIGLKKVFSNNVVLGIEANVNAGPMNAIIHADKATANLESKQVTYDLRVKSNGVSPGLSASVGYIIDGKTMVFASVGGVYSKITERYQQWGIQTSGDADEAAAAKRNIATFFINNGGISPVFGIGMSHRINPKMNVEVSASYALEKTKPYTVNDKNHMWLGKKGSITTRIMCSYAIPIAR